MSEHKLFESFSELDPDLLARSQRRRPGRGKIVTAMALTAACAALAVGLALPSLRDPSLPPDIPAPDTPVAPPEAPVTPETPETPEVPPETPPETPEDPEVLTPQEEPMSPPELVFNQVETSDLPSVTPPVWYFELDDVPLTARQLELCWSLDCPAAFIEIGEGGEQWVYPERWDRWGCAVQGAARYSGEDLYCLALTVREDWTDLRASLTIADPETPLFTGCISPETAEPSAFGPLTVTACRYDYGDTVTLTAEFEIADVLYRAAVQAPAEQENDAGLLLTNVVTRFQLNALENAVPDLASFRRDDPASGALEGQEALLALAEAACTIPHDTAELLGYDREMDAWAVCFYTAGTVGDDQTVYIDGEGVIKLIVYGE